MLACSCCCPVQCSRDGGMAAVPRCSLVPEQPRWRRWPAPSPPTLLRLINAPSRQRVANVLGDLGVLRHERLELERWSLLSRRLRISASWPGNGFFLLWHGVLRRKSCRPPASGPARGDDQAAGVAAMPAPTTRRPVLQRAVALPCGVDRLPRGLTPAPCENHATGLRSASHEGDRRRRRTGEAACRRHARAVVRPASGGRVEAQRAQLLCDQVSHGRLQKKGRLGGRSVVSADV